MMTADEALNLPVSPGVAAHVWQAHEEQLERLKREQGAGVELRGQLQWSVTLGGYQFVPDETCLDALMDRIADGTWHLGVKVTLTL